MAAAVLLLSPAGPRAWGPAEAEARINSRFGLVVPDGFEDLSDGATPSQIARLHPALLEPAMRTEYLIFAADLEPGADDRNSFVQGVLLPSGIAITNESLPSIRDALVKRHAGEDVTLRFDTLDIVQIGGVDVARAVFSLRGEGADDMRLVYVVPGRDTAALLVYGSTAERFARMRPVFERAAMKTTGAEPSAARSSASSRARWLEIGASLAIVVATIGLLFGKRSASARTRATARPPTPLPSSHRSGPPSSDAADDGDDHDGDDHDGDDHDGDDHDEARTSDDPAAAHAHHPDRTPTASTSPTGPTARRSRGG